MEHDHTKKDRLTQRHLIKVNRRYCPHCDRSLSIKTFKAHKRLYFNFATMEWPAKDVSDVSNVSSNERLESPPASIGYITTIDNDLPHFVSPCSSDVEDQWTIEENENHDDNEDSEHEVWTTEDNMEMLRDWESDSEDEAPSSEEVTVDPTAGHLFAWILTFLFHLQAHYHLTENVLKMMLNFLKVFLSILGRFSTLCGTIASKIPTSLHMLWKLHSNSTKAVKRFVVCKKCHQIYFFHDCIRGSALHRVSKKCSYRPFPNHPHSRNRQQCGSTLLKTVDLISGKKLLYPFLTYCYLGLEIPLQTFLRSTDFVSACEEWRKREVTDNVYEDIFDGKLWNDFLEYNGTPFLSAPFTFAFMMNIDWFQPYKHVSYSVGVIYLVCMNLPRSLRFKTENVILAGIIPGPREPSKNINSYLSPLVDEFLSSWEGVEMTVANWGEKKIVRCALLSVACDLPAGRKVCGFLSYTAALGCSRCLKLFTGKVGEVDYSGFDRHNWPLRTEQQHKACALELQNCITKTGLQQSEARTGCRYTELIRLPYFNGPRMLIIDPMHNLFLGSAKYYIKRIWLHNDLVSIEQYDLIQSRVDNAIVPADIGRIPYKILSGFASFTADQMKNWVVYYSIIALKDILTGDDLECWRHYVLACRILCSRKISKHDILLADALLLNFCKRTQRLYGNQVITPNMHMHCHLKECLLDYGPVYGFWLFAFERYNGLLGEFPTNNRSIELQLMNRFIRDTCSLSHLMPAEYKNELGPIFHVPQAKGTLLETNESLYSLPFITSFRNCSHSIVLPTHYSRGCISSCEIESLKKLYSSLYSVPVTDIEVPSCYRKYTTLKVNQKQIGSYKSRSSNSSLVMAYWNPQLFGLTSSSTPLCDSDIVERPVRIHHFLYLSVTIQGSQESCVCFSCSWFKSHPCKDVYGKPVSVWECDLFDTHGCFILPIQFMKCRTVSLIDKVNGMSALLVCPCIDF